MSKPLPDRRAVLLGASAFLLAGCSDLIGPTSTPQQLYVLQPRGGVSTAGPKTQASLVVTTTTVSEHLENARIALIQPDSSIDFYANSAWSDHLPVLVQNALVEAFENSGRIDAVSGDNEGFHADYFLQAEIRNFEAHYAQPDGIPTVMVRIQAKLAPSKGREIIGNLNSVHQIVASANSVPAVVQAFDQALGEVFSEIVNWALKTAVG
ncbi:MAG TPA: ABC-type transport auxiliary lipoprotein family protein [Rhizomicrobium sp.]|nr:ABC-type transport auxiliary lipoprotein family protein [Rhizomicrobium sp.]